MTWRGLRRFLWRSLESVPTGAKVLNVGAGGRTARVIESIRRVQNFTVLSLDIDPSRGPDVVADVITYDPNEQYDVVVMIEVLEHVRQPRAALQNIHRLLKPGGRLVLSTPFLFPLHDRPMDFFRYTRYGLTDLCARFESLEIGERDGWGEVICVLLARLLKERSFGARLLGPLAVLIAAIFYPLAMVLTRLIPSDAFTSGYTLLASKAAGQQTQLAE